MKLCERLRDYREEMDSLLACLEGSFEASSTAMYSEQLPEEDSSMGKRVAEVDQKIASVADEARKAQYEADTLALARDVAQIGQIFREVQKSDQARRTEKILHSRNQNTIGAAIVSEWMASHCHVMSGVVKEQLSAIETVGLSCFSLV